MSAMSFATARLMETWAHGQDVRDALGLEPAVSARLRHVADLGVRTHRSRTGRGAGLPATRCGSSSSAPTVRRGCGAPTTPTTWCAARRWTSVSW